MNWSGLPGKPAYLLDEQGTDFVQQFLQRLAGQLPVQCGRIFSRDAAVVSEIVSEDRPAILLGEPHIRCRTVKRHLIPSLMALVTRPAAPASSLASGDASHQHSRAGGFDLRISLVQQVLGLARSMPESSCPTQPTYHRPSLN